ncbi:hypothetical protein [Agreia sp. COWG]|nr:hypothetical protein [Agreia sp. COWG]
MTDITDSGRPDPDALPDGSGSDGTSQTDGGEDTASGGGADDE